MSKRLDSAENYAIKVIPNMPWRIAKVYALPNYIIEVTFRDGTYGKVDLSRRVKSKNAGVFSALKDPKLFEQVGLEYGAVVWPGEIDLAPDAMYKEIKKNGIWILEGFK